MTLFTFRLGNHELNTKPGHTKACGAIQATMGVYASTVEEAIDSVNAWLAEQKRAYQKGMGLGHHTGDVSVIVSFDCKVTKRNLIK